MNAHLRRMLIPDVSSKYGATMGRHNIPPSDIDARIKLRLQKMSFVDGDYDQGGAYWGGGTGTWIWVAWGYFNDLLVVYYVRARNREEAKAEVYEINPRMSFYK